jgi:hypothetical protein
VKRNEKRIGEILIERGYITEAQLHDALSDSRLGDKFLGSRLLSRGAITPDALCAALAEQFGMPLVDLKRQHIDFELARKFSASLILDHKCFPLKEDEFSFTVAIVNPLDEVALSRLDEEAKPRSVILAIAPENDMEAVLENYRIFISQDIQRLLRKRPVKTSKP